MKNILFLVVLLPSVLSAQPGVSWSAFIQERGLYFRSERVTMAGVGADAGIQAVWNGSYIAQADAGILWGNGNAVPVRLGFGLQKEGNWSPAVMATFSLLCGDRTEILSKTGLRPIVPIWTAGILVAPLRYERSFGTFSVLEFGTGIGPYRGISFELTLLSAGVRL